MTTWIWENTDWADFKFDKTRLERLLTRFDFNNQLSLRDTILFENVESEEFVVNIQGLEAIKTSEIEGENYELPQIIKSIKSGFNILADTDKKDKTELDKKRRKSIAAMMVDLYRGFDQPLDEDTLHRWNAMLTYDEESERNTFSGVYRPYKDTMEVGNGAPGIPPAYVAPPMESVQPEMDRFIEWFNDTGPNGKNPMHRVIRAGLAHLYFVAIHPYDDGNGRIARALATKCISQSNGEPTLISLSHAISDSSSGYYSALEKATKHGDIDAWLEYFCETAVEAQEITKQKLYNAAIEKTIMSRHGDNLNEDQKAIVSAMLSGQGTKKPGILSVAEYVQYNKSNILVRAREDGKPFKDIAKDDIDKMVKARIIRRATDTESERYVLVYPRSQGIRELKPDSPNRKKLQGVSR